jgi:hypothetical protein
MFTIRLRLRGLDPRQRGSDSLLSRGPLGIGTRHFLDGSDRKDRVDSDPELERMIAPNPPNLR